MGCNLKVCVAAVYNEEGKKYDSGYKKEEKKDESGYKKEEKKDESGYKKEEEKDESGYEKEEEKDESGYTQEEEKDESSYNKRKKREYKEEGKKDKTGFALAVTYENVCELMKRIGGRVDIISVHISLGECGPLLVPNSERSLISLRNMYIDTPNETDMSLARSQFNN
jgi:AAA15 family ATPase/GTPase